MEYKSTKASREESKQDRFIRVAEKRVQRVLQNIQALSKCSNKRMYSWNDNQLRIIWKAIDEEYKRCKLSFKGDDVTHFRLK